MNDILIIIFIFVFLADGISNTARTKQYKKLEAAKDKQTRAILDQNKLLSQIMIYKKTQNSLLTEQKEILLENKKATTDFLMTLAKQVITEKEQDHDRTNTDGSGRSPEDRTAGDQ